MLEKIAPLATSSANWKIVQKFNIKPYYSKIEDISSALNKSVKFCDYLGSYCKHNQHLEFLREQLNSAEKNTAKTIDLLVGHGEAKSSRTKRSLIPIIGTLARVIFGVTTETEETEIRRAIEITANDTRAIAALLANQTELVATQLNVTNHRIDKLQLAVAKLKDDISWADAKRAMDIAAQILGEQINAFLLETEVLTESIIMAAQGSLHPKLMSPSTIAKSAELVEKTLADVEFPLKAADSVLNLMKISEIAIMFINFKLVYYISVPLIDLQRYTLEKAIPIPARQQFASAAVFAYIWPDSSYIAVDPESRTYFPLRDDALAKCKQINGLYICGNSEPIREIQKHSPCELRVAINREISNVSECSIRVVQLHETYWTQLSEKNAWAYSTTEQEQLFIQCWKGEHISAEIEGAGVLRLR